MRIEWHPAALAEFVADVEWYEQREAGLGDRFEGAVLSAVDAAVQAPEAWAIWWGWDRVPAVRAKGVDGFPYRVVYVVRDHVLAVVAVAHARRRPGYWRARVDT
ncbi:type II toxin-antitoxin system RelE/ParE family toxin [Demequina silvatica]|uniref:type II toxin-antitoxin system RelE/ParE family toxin n=1 Tax=Demequina silvatica TaxID=1638988 RepID=UPI000783F30C|nr:type II toxin-antitoxin system RelE/ParE family toxin [Demequina silvatica]